MKRILATVAILAGVGMATSAIAEYRNYAHSGCTKDHVKVTEAIVWNCKGICKTTPLKAQIMREAKDSRAIYPRVVAKYTKAQIMKQGHVKEIISKAKIKSKLTADPPKFGGSC